MNEADVPVFVRVEAYREVVAMLDSIKEKLSEARQTLEKLKELKSQEDAELQSWENTVADAENKIAEIDQSLVQQNA